MIAQHSTSDALQPLACLVDDSGPFRSFVMSDFRGTSEREKINHVLLKAEKYCSYTGLLAQRSDITKISQVNVLCAYTRPLVSAETWHSSTGGMLQLKMVIKYRYHGPAPLWFTVSVQHDHHHEPRHNTDKSHAVLIHTPATARPAGDTTAALTHTLQWHHGSKASWDALFRRPHEGNRICVWAHTE